MAINYRFISDIYKKKSLNRIVDCFSQGIEEKESNIKCSSFQRSTMAKIWPEFHYDFSNTSKVEIDQQLGPSDLATIFCNLPDSTLESYLENAIHDDLSPLAYINQGRIIVHNKLREQNEWMSHPFFVNHCMKYGIYGSSSIGYLYPAHRATYIAFDYMGNKTNKCWDNIDHLPLEYLSFPFALAWLYRFGAMDIEELERRFHALSDLTYLELSRLRKYINAPHQTFAQQAKLLDIKERRLKEGLYDLREKLSPRFGWQSSEELGNRRRSLRQMESEYHFLSMMGDQTEAVNYHPQ